MTRSTFLLVLLGCAGSGDTEPVDSDQFTDTAETEAPEARFIDINVEVTLDGDPLAGAVVVQGGRDGHWTTDAAGRATVTFDTSVGGGLARSVISSHPDARIGAAIVNVDRETPHRIELERFAVGDNPDYVFQDPGEPDRRGTTGQCAHCHVTLNQDWYDSPHRTSASNPVVQDVYASATAIHTPESRFGGCADCHAPGIDGDLGGRDLAEASDFALDYGVHCDVCHKVESVDMLAEPGVAGRLVLNRPLEPDDDPLGEPWRPLMFGPYDDVAHPRMGSVPRALFHEAELCGGCHQQEQQVLVANAAINTERWPSGRLPIHTTYEEWAAAPTSPELACQGCHMPAASGVGNSADLGNMFDVAEGAAGGWYRLPGSVRHHSWPGPRQRSAGFLELAATVQLQTELTGDGFVVSATVRNIGPAHALPTGEPMRSVILAVRSQCDGTEMKPTGGDVVPDYGGTVATKAVGEDWGIWPQASVGDVIRVTERTGAWHDYPGFGPFGDGRFEAPEKGLPVEVAKGVSRVVAVDGSTGQVTLDGPLPAGDTAYLSRVGWPTDASAAQTLAGHPGFGFARVLVGAGGSRMVPHHQAVDVVSDNRLLPGASWTSSHTFDASSCVSAPTATAALVHRAYPFRLAIDNGWPLVDSVMTEVQR